MTGKNPDMTPEERKAQRIVDDLRRKWKNGELTEEQISQLEALGISKHSRLDVVVGVNDLATVNPDLAAQWHPTKNGRLTPRDVMAGSGKKVWWLGPCGHEWEAAVYNRNTLGSGCVYCSNKALLPGYNDLFTTNPNLAAQWHPTRNGSLTPQDVMAGSRRRAWWMCEKGHEWEMQISDRNAGQGCPYCSGHRLLQGYNDLATTNPDLAAQWHPTKNGDLTPRDVMAGSAKKAWWRCDEGHEWEAAVCCRADGNGCPYCGGRKILAGFNDLATLRPDLAAQWHPTKNGDLTPQNTAPSDRKKVWWQCERGHEWEAAVGSRVYGKAGCPVCTRGILCVGYNDLATVSPELAAQWHPTKNGDLTPKQVTSRSGKKVWWLGECGHEWEAVIGSRAKGSGCPYCSGHKLLRGYNDLATTAPDLAAQWHPTKNGDLTPRDVMASGKKKVWWQCERSHEWEARLYSRNTGSGCPVCALESRRAARTAGSGSSDAGSSVLDGQSSARRQAVVKDLRRKWKRGELSEDQVARLERLGITRHTRLDAVVGVNDLVTADPDLAAEWHPVKNGELTPQDVKTGSDKKVWWLGECGHEWEAVIKNRAVNKTGCPYCANKKVLSGFNDLATTDPDLAAQWHPTKNGDLTPQSVRRGSDKKVWWLGECGHEWEATVNCRVNNGGGCPVCSGRKVSAGVNDLATIRPDLAAQWRPDKNGDLTPQDVTAGSSKRVWWVCEKGHEWVASVASRVSGGSCPVCAGRKVLPGFNDLVTVNPALAAQWHPTKNGELTPQDVTARSNKKVWWRCGKGHEWVAEIASRSYGSGCPVCARNARKRKGDQR